MSAPSAEHHFAVAGDTNCVMKRLVLLFSITIVDTLVMRALQAKIAASECPPGATVSYEKLRAVVKPMFAFKSGVIFLLFF